MTTTADPEPGWSRVRDQPGGGCDSGRPDRPVGEGQGRCSGGAGGGDRSRSARSQVAKQQDAGVSYRRLGQGIAEQVGLATGTSGWHGARKPTLARDLISELPRTFGLLAASNVQDLGPKQAAGLARRRAQEADPAGAVKRARYARSERQVSLRPAPDTMCWLSALLPVAAGVRAFAALTRQADTVKARGDERTRGQVMADTAVERLTGQAGAHRQPAGRAEPDGSVGASARPDQRNFGRHPRLWTDPAGLADDILGSAGAQVWWRRLFTAPATAGGRVIVGGDPTVRRFTGWLPKLLRLTRRRPLPRTALRRPDPPYRPHPAEAGQRPDRLTRTAAACVSGTTKFASCPAGQSRSTTSTATACHR